MMANKDRDGRDARHAVLSRLQGICAMRRGAGGLKPPQAPPRPDLSPLADPERRLAIFVEQAEAAGAVAEVLAKMTDVPEAVAVIARRHGLTDSPVWAPEAALARLDWAAAGLAVHATATLPLPCPEDGLVAVTPAVCAVAETGSLVFASAPSHPATAAFLPRVHVAVVTVENIVAGLDDAWVTLRTGDACGTMPRVVNWVTGPSRTADIEQTLVEGAHGPAHLHVLVVREG